MTLEEALTPEDLAKIRVEPTSRDEPFDKITIEIVPRFKTSGTSGDQWRHSAHIQFFRKGMLAAEDNFHTMKVACDMLPGLMQQVPEMHSRMAEKRELEGGTYDAPMFSGLPVTLCFQAGCCAKSTLLYRIKRRYSPQGHLLAERYQDRPAEHRAFCDEHKDRGDCGLDDAMDNYEVVELPSS